MERPQRVAMITFAERCKRLYLFGRKDLFADRSRLRKANASHDAAIASLEPAGVALSDSNKLAIDFFKSSVKAGDVICMPQRSLDLAQYKQAPVAVDHGHADWLKLFKQKPVSIASIAASVFLEIIDNRPESKAQVKSAVRHPSPHDL